MRRVVLTAAALGLVLGTHAARAQWGGGFGGRGGGRGRGGDPYGREVQAPKMPGAELDGPADSATARELLSLTDPQSAQYAQAYDSFMTVTKPQRDSVQVATAKMNDRLDNGDRAAAQFYAERIQDLGKELKDKQDKFDKVLGHFLSGDQMKSYRRWEDDQERAAEERNREAALKWRESAFGGAGGRMATVPLPDQKSFPAAAGVPAPAVGSQAVRVGRTVYVSTQLALDSGGAVIGGSDLRSQAVRAFANLAAVLRSAGAWTQDVVALTVYVVDYRPADLTTIRDAGSAYFGGNPPATTVIGVEALAQQGALIGVAATAVASSAGTARAARDR